MLTSFGVKDDLDRSQDRPTSEKDTPHGCSCFGPHYEGNVACPINRDESTSRPYWTKSSYPGMMGGGAGEYNCPHGIGHGNHTHGCDGCCQRDDFPLRVKK